MAGITDDDLANLAAELYARRKSGVLVQRANVRNSGWEPVENECHANVARWVQENPENSHVYGFLYFDLGGFLPFVLFNAHSVVRLKNGDLVDITPTRATDYYPFIEHIGSVELFAAADERIRLEHIKQGGF